MPWQNIPISVFAVLNLVLAVSLVRKLRGAALCFALAGALLLAGIAGHSAGFVLCGAGFSLLAPLWVGRSQGKLRWLHHGLRLLVVVALWKLWTSQP